MKNIFYRNRLRMPNWMQLYVTWVVLLLIVIPVIFYTGTLEKKDFKARQSVIPEPVFNETTVSNIIQAAKTKLYVENILQPQNFETAKSAFGIPTWIVENHTKTIAGRECTYSSLFKPGTGNKSIVFGLNKNSHGDLFKSALVVMNSIDNLPLKNTVIFAFIEDIYRCFHDDVLLTNISGIKGEAYFIFLNIHDNEKLSLSINGTMKNVSSLNWQFALPKTEEFPGFIRQIGLSMSPVFQGPESAILAQGIPAIGLFYPSGAQELKNTVTIAKDLKKTVQYFENNPDPEIENASFWLSGNRSFSIGGFRILIGLLILLIWFPLVNRLYVRSESMEIVRGLFALIYYSIVPVFFLIGVKLIYDLGKTPEYMIPVLMLGSFILLFVLKRLENNIFNLKINISTSIFVFNLIMTLTGLLQPILFIILTPLALTLSKCARTKGLVSLFWFIIGILPVILTLYSSIPEEHVNLLLSASFYLSTFFNNFGNTANSLLLVGAMVSILRHRK